MPDTTRTCNAGLIKNQQKGQTYARKLILFTNDVTVTADMNVSALTQPNSGSGWAAAKDLASWPTPAMVGSVSSSTHPDVSFAFTGLSPAVTIRGFAMYDALDNPATAKVTEIVKFEFPDTISGNGSHTVSPTVTHATV